jgi:hypothetical protein
MPTLSNVDLIEGQGHQERGGVRRYLRLRARTRWFTKLASRHGWLTSSQHVRLGSPGRPAVATTTSGTRASGRGRGDVVCREGVAAGSVRNGASGRTGSGGV